MNQVNVENISKGPEIFDEDINFKKITGTIKRNKKIIYSTALLSFIVSVIYAYLTPKIWKGNFQIVLSSDKSSSTNNLLSSSGLPKSLSITGAFVNDDLATEVEKLRSPSVLMQVYDFYKKDLKNKQYSLSFTEWLKKFDIKLTSKTSVLSIDFKDQNKENILPVLKKVSEVYQKYSGRDRNKKIQNSSIFLNNQIKEYKIKSLESLKNAQNFATANDLIFDDSSSEKTNIKNFLADQGSLNITNPNIDIEKRRVIAANKIKFIDLQLKNIQSNNSVEEIKYLSSTIPGLDKVIKPYFDQLTTIKSQLLNLEQFYKKNDPNVKQLYLIENSLLESIKRESIVFLNAQKITEQANLNASKRKDSILIKFKELIRENKRNNNTLVALEEQLRQTNLEKARNQEPWELITNPTVSDYPIYPVKKRIAFLGTLLGTLIAIIYSFIKENNSKKIFHLEDLEQIINFPKIAKIDNILSINNNLISLEYSIKKLNKDNQISLISMGDINKPNLECLVKKLSVSLKDRRFKSMTDLRKLNNSDNVYLVTSLGVVTKSEIDEIKNILSLSQSNIVGWILLTKESIN